MRGGVEIRTNLKAFLLIALAIVILDQATKAVIIGRVAVNDGFNVVPGLFDIVHFRNTGAAFSLFSDGGLLKKLFLALTSIAALAVIWFLVKNERRRLMAFALSLIAGGAAGNLIDRIRLGEVVDFLYFSLRGYHWPAFNVADSAITVGVGLAIFSYLRGEK